MSTVPPSETGHNVNSHAIANKVQKPPSDGVTVLEVPVFSDSSKVSTHAHAQAFQKDSPKDSDANMQISSNVEGSDDSLLSNDVDLQNRLSEQDIRDTLFEAGYSINEIDNIVAAKSELGGTGDPLDSTVSIDSDLSLSESVAGNASDILREIRVKNVDKIVIGTLNINSLAPKFDQLSEVIGKHVDILTIQ